MSVVAKMFIEGFKQPAVKSPSPPTIFQQPGKQGNSKAASSTRPLGLQGLVVAVQEKGLSEMAVIYDFVNSSTVDEEHFNCLMRESFNHPSLQCYQHFSFDQHKLAPGEWTYGQGDQLEDLVGFIHFLATHGGEDVRVRIPDSSAAMQTETDVSVCAIT